MLATDTIHVSIIIRGKKKPTLFKNLWGRASQGPGFPKMLSVSPAPTLHPAVLTALGFTQEHNRVCRYDWGRTTAGCPDFLGH